MKQFEVAPCRRTQKKSATGKWSMIFDVFRATLQDERMKEEKSQRYKFATSIDHQFSILRSRALITKE